MVVEAILFGCGYAVLGLEDGGSSNKNRLACDDDQSGLNKHE